MKNMGKGEILAR